MRIPLYLAISSGLLIAAPAQARHQSKSIVVVGERVSLTDWSKHMTKALERQMVYPSYLTLAEPHEGVVRVSFLCSESGRPTAVTLQDSSGHRDIDQAAMRAVQRIPTLHPLAEGLTHAQRYQAVLLFAKDQASYDRQIAAIEEDVARRNAWFGQGGAQVAMGVSLMPAG